MGGGRVFLIPFLLAFAPLLPAVAVSWVATGASPQRLRLLRRVELILPLAAAGFCFIAGLALRDPFEGAAASIFLFGAFIGFLRPYRFGRSSNPRTNEAFTVYVYCGVMLGALALAVEPVTHWMEFLQR